MRQDIRRAALLAAAAIVAGCSSSAPGSASLTLNDPYWNRVNVEIVVTKRSDCDSREEGYISNEKVVMFKNTTQRFEVPSGANLCWRHDSNPDKPVPGAWSGWTKATLFPGQNATSDL